MKILQLLLVLMIPYFIQIILGFLFLHDIKEK